MSKKPKNVVIDNVAVRRRIQGFHRTELNRAEMRHAVRVLHQAGKLDSEISESLGISKDAAFKIRTRLGLGKNTPTGRDRLVDA